MDRILSGYVMGLPGIHAMFAGADLRFERPLVSGDRLTPTARLKELIERPSKFAGRSFQQIYEVEFRDEAGDLVALTAYVGHQSRGVPVAVTVDVHNRRYFERGQALYYTRSGQMNLACTHCHDRNWGRQLLAETISQGHGNAYPVYRLEWQSAGSLARRIRACYFGLRAEMPAYGAQELLDLELYLAWRGSGLPIETPGVRR